jgi:hypothetical protein
MLVWENYNVSPAVKMPYVELNLCKNKINGVVDRFAYKLNSYNLRMLEVPWSEVQAKINLKGKNKLISGSQVY